MNRFLPALGVAPAFLTAFLPFTATSGQSLARLEPDPARRYPFPLTIESIMRGPELLGQAPSQVRWTDDSRWIYFRWLPGGRPWHEPARLYRVPAAGGEPREVPPTETDSVALLTAPGAVSRDRKWRVSSVQGDLYLVERATLKVRRLTDTREAETSPTFSASGSSVFFQMGGNLFELELAQGKVRQLTDIRTGPAPRDSAAAQGHRAFLEAQQEKLFEHIRVDKARRAREDSLRREQEARRPQPTYLANNERVTALIPNPAGTYVAVQAIRQAQGARNTMVPAWVTSSGFTEPLNSRAKVGDAQNEPRLGLLEVSTGKLTWLEPFPPISEQERELQSVRSTGPRLAGAMFAGWNDAGTLGLIWSRSANNKNRWIYSVEAATGGMTLLDSLHDEAWIGGPCASCLGWIPGQDRVWFVSEVTGYAHLYAVDADGTGHRALTEGPWEVLSVEILEDRSRFLLHTNEGSPFNQHVFTLDFDGSARTMLTSGKGAFRGTPSPDGRRMAVLHSRANHPDELFVADFRAGASLRRLTTSPTQEWLSFPWLEPEIVHFPARDKVMVPARIYRPRDLGAQPNGAAVLFVHGAGYLQNVHNFWSSYYREYMFHHFLAAAGYTVLDVDYRGSAGYGRDWRTAIYRWMGGKDLSDYTDAVVWLVREEGVDPARIGIYGGSYGGFLTLMALFTEPEVFKTGAALRSVTDWAHYNHGYTSNILNLPHQDPEAYERSSPIYFAENFKGHLLIAHGMVDVNVHFSDVVRLAQRLIELGKENWEMAVYPVEDHGFVAPSGWTDEYRRIFELFQRTLSRPACTDHYDLCPAWGGR